MGANADTVAQISIRPAQPDEAEYITALVMRSKAYWGYDADFLAACRPGLTITADYITNHPAFVAEDDGIAVGFASLYEHSPAEVELDFLFIAPEAIGKGVGKRLWQHAVATAHQHGYRIIRIVADPNAESFYQKIGAVTVGDVPSEAKAGRTLPLMHFPLVDQPGDVDGFPSHREGLGRGRAAHQYLDVRVLAQEAIMRPKVVLEPSEDGYTVYVPSLPGCISEGSTA